jgi:DNA recombination protein RmuC
MSESAAMSPVFLFLLFLLVAGAAYAAWEWRNAAAGRGKAEQDLAAAKAKLEQVDTFRAERDAAVASRDAALAETSRLVAELAAERSGSEARNAAATEREQALIAMKADVEKSFLALAQQALSQNEQRFLNLANETFEKHKTAATGGMKEMVAPVQEQFVRLTETIAALDKSRTEDKSALFEQMRQVTDTLQQTQKETGKLANALRAAPKARGRWGEETLRNVLELAGLSHHIDFTQQSSHEGEGGKLRPDVLIKLPGGRCIVVDSKVALSGYMDAAEATDEQTRDILLKKHASEIRTHMKQLASKEYARHVPQTADFVVMFVPGENFIAAAFEHDSALFQDAIAERVIIVGPSSLLALAKSISYGWRQEEVAKNAEQIAEIGGQLYARLATMSGRLDALGNSLEKSVRSYNELVSTVESRVFPSARRFRDLGAGEASDEIKLVEPKDIAVRLPAPPVEDDGPKAKKRTLL